MGGHMHKAFPMSKKFRTKLIIYSVPIEFCLEQISISAVLKLKQFKGFKGINRDMQTKSARLSRNERIFPKNVITKLRRRD